MAGFYRPPFTNVAKRSFLATLNAAELEESFMDVARAIRACLFVYMKVEQESCEVLPLGANKEIDKQVNTYLIHYKNMTQTNVSIVEWLICFVFVRSVFFYFFSYFEEKCISK